MESYEFNNAMQQSGKHIPPYVKSRVSAALKKWENDTTNALSSMEFDNASVATTLLLPLLLGAALLLYYRAASRRDEQNPYHVVRRPAFTPSACMSENA